MSARARLLACALPLLAVVAAADAVARCPRGTRQQLRHRGKERRCVLPDGTLHGPYRRSFRLSRDIGAYDHGVRQGAWRTELFTGERHTFRYVDGKLDGPVRRYDRKGRLLTVQTYRAGRLHGESRSAWPDGRKHERGQYRDGQRVGRWLRWYADGSLAVEAHYDAGRRDGAFRRLWPGGALYEQGRYVKGDRDGPWRGGLEDGRPLYAGSWRRGVQVGEWVFFGADGAPTQRWRPVPISP